MLFRSQEGGTRSARRVSSRCLEHALEIVAARHRLWDQRTADPGSIPKFCFNSGTSSLGNYSLSGGISAPPATSRAPVAPLPFEWFSGTGDPPRAHLGDSLELTQFRSSLRLVQSHLEGFLSGPSHLLLPLRPLHGYGILLGSEALFVSCSTGHSRPTNDRARRVFQSWKMKTKVRRDAPSPLDRSRARGQDLRLSHYAAAPYF